MSSWRVIPLISNVQGRVRSPRFSVEALSRGNGCRDAHRGWAAGLAHAAHRETSPRRCTDDGTVLCAHEPLRRDAQAGSCRGPYREVRWRDRIRDKVVLLGHERPGHPRLQDDGRWGSSFPGWRCNAQMVENLFNGVSLVSPGRDAVSRGAHAGVRRPHAQPGSFRALPRPAGHQPRGDAWCWFSCSSASSRFATSTCCSTSRGPGDRYPRGVHDDGDRHAFRRRNASAASCATRPRAWRARVDAAAGASRWACCPTPREPGRGSPLSKSPALLEPGRARSAATSTIASCANEDHVVFPGRGTCRARGFPAALFMASVKSHLKSAALRGGDAGEVLAAARQAENRGAREPGAAVRHPRSSASSEASTGVLEYSSAGPRAAVRARKSRGTPERFDTPGGPAALRGGRLPLRSGRARRMSPRGMACAR